MAFPTYIPAYGGFNGGYYPNQQAAQPFQWQGQTAAAIPASNCPQSQSGLNWVEGAEAAKACTVTPNGTLVLFDTKEPIMYIKSADQSGMPSTRTFKIEEIGDMPISAVKAEDSDSKEEIRRLEDRITALETQIKGFSKSKGKAKEVSEDEPVV